MRTTPVDLRDVSLKTHAMDENHAPPHANTKASAPVCASPASSATTSHSSGTESATESVSVSPMAHAKPPSKKKEPLSPNALEQRRRRNRESMQRARERERGDVARMRVQLKELEVKYQQAAQAHKVFLTQYINPQLAQFNELADESKELMEQNFTLQQDLEVRRKAYERMERIVADYHLEKDAEAEQLDETDQDQRLNSVSAPLMDVRPISEAQASVFIQDCYQDIEAFEQSANGPHMHHVQDCFGWSIKHQITEGTRIRFLFSKQFAHVYPDASMDEAWEMYGKLAQNNHKDIRVLRLQVLQQINQHTQVVVRDIAHPLDKGVVLRTLMIRFRLKTAKGLVGGRVAINPKTPPPDAHVRYADVTSWVEFQYLDSSRPDLPGCRVTFGGFAGYGTNRELSGRFLTIMSTVLTMEHRLFQPMPQLLPLSTDRDEHSDSKPRRTLEIASNDHPHSSRRDNSDYDMRE